MYSRSLTDRKIARVEKKLGQPLTRYPEGKTIDLIHHFNSLVKEKDTYGNVTKLARPITSEEQSFILNEQLLCGLDFEYWLNRYCVIYYDGAVGGGVGPMHLWEAQRIVMDLIAKLEDECWQRSQKDQPVEGIKVVDHKSRQLGGTMLKRALDVHRVTTTRYQRGIVASVDDEKIQKIYVRDKLIIDNLPFYLRPTLTNDVKGQHIAFGELGSNIQYSQSNQKGGLGQGEQFDIGHLTEVASWPNPEIIDLYTKDGFPLGPNTLVVYESTANGNAGWWPEFTDRVRRGLERGWAYCFIPWYAEPKKYRALPPSKWKPNQHTILHAAKVKDTSLEFVNKVVNLQREQLYWYETERESAREKGSLNLFLTNYAATPEESFQHSGISAFSTELIDELRTKARWGVPYEVML